MGIGYAGRSDDALGTPAWFVNFLFVRTRVEPNLEVELSFPTFESKVVDAPGTMDVQMREWRASSDLGLLVRPIPNLYVGAGLGFQDTRSYKRDRSPTSIDHDWTRTDSSWSPEVFGAFGADWFTQTRKRAKLGAGIDLRVYRVDGEPATAQVAIYAAVTH
jgi:hypothetical protein